MDKLLLGIDFGTSTNFVTKYDFNKKDAVAVANMGDYGNSNIFENCIYIESEKNFVIGQPKKGVNDPWNFFQDVKRFITSDDWKKKVPNLNDREVTAQDLTTMIFSAIKTKVEYSEARPVDGAVITVPYAYGDKYKKRLKKAAEDAGIKVIQLVEEPVAAAISFGIFSGDIEPDKKEKIVVFDLGGGTFDITVFEFQKNDQRHAKIEVLNTDGVEKLGGKTIDELISDKFRETLGIEYCDFSNKKEESNFRNKLNSVARDTKEELSFNELADVYESFAINLNTEELELEIERNDFNDWLKNNNIIGQIEDALDRAIYDIDLEPEDIDRIILAGGTSSIPLIKEAVRDFFGKEPESKQNLGELVGHGAGILAGLSADNSLQYEVIRKTSKDVGIATGQKFKRILHKNERYGAISTGYKVKLSNTESALQVTFYEGISNRIEDCEKFGTATINGQLFSNGIIYISLMRDKDTGRIKYYFNDENKIEIDMGFLQDVG
ncbi:Hsp70 family protein [Photobacterium phosphoreum]|uniref:Hsp70 family protein n=1 Tax=Photobacterium phosphoreum TaxID=659 RepID=UPI000D1569C4|nr:Hsp70 family protein [Photobacterium phosphoreum]PTB30973.1 hypothetical protein DAT36_19445 [Photobacterium phosphoreum]